MANKKECEICKKAIQEKYKHYKIWRALAIVFMCLTLMLCVLYFAEGDIFKETINNNDVEILNRGDSNNNNVVINN